MNTLKISINAAGQGKILLGDVDISSSFRGFRIESFIGEITKIELIAIADVEIQIDDVTALETTNVGSVCRSFVPLN